MPITWNSRTTFWETWSPDHAGSSSKFSKWTNVHTRSLRRLSPSSPSQPVTKRFLLKLNTLSMGHRLRKSFGGLDHGSVLDLTEWDTWFWSKGNNSVAHGSQEPSGPSSTLLQQKHRKPNGRCGLSEKGRENQLFSINLVFKSPLTMLASGKQEGRFCSYEMQSNPKPLWVWFGFICLKFCDSFKTQLCHPLQPRSFAFWIPGLTSGTFSLLLPFI